MGKVDLILKALEEAGLKLEAGQRTAVADELKDIPLVESTSALKDGQVAVDESFYNSQRADLKKWKEKARTLEGELEEIKDATQSGESVLKRTVALQKQRIEELEPRYQALIKAQRDRWTREGEKIPEKLRAKFKYGDPKAKDGNGDLSDEELLANLARLDEYTELGLMGEAPKETPSLTPGRTGPGAPPAGKEDWDKKSPKDRIAMGYKTTEAEKK